jgi:hypothetical protein
MGGGDAGDMVFAWVGGVIAMSVALPVIVAVCMLLLIGKLLLKLGRVLLRLGGLVYELARGSAYQRELRRTIRVRNEAITSILALHNHALREMERISRQHRVLERGGRR